MYGDKFQAIQPAHQTKCQQMKSVLPQYRTMRSDSL
jgi:hypothetical protein